MKKLRRIIYIIICLIAVIVVICSLLSILRNTENRFLKMLDFPRIQFFIVSILSIILLILFTVKWKWYDYLLTIGLIGGVMIHGVYLVHYTTFVPETVTTAYEEDNAREDQVSILLVNVKMTNKTVQPLLNTIKAKDPDLIITLEMDDWWMEQLKSIERNYKFTQKRTNEVAYGMCLYSKFPLENSKVSYLQNKSVPSFENMIKLKSGKRFILHSIHPVPPTLFEELPDNAGEEEVTLIKIGEKVKKSKLPSIVAGDINDVSWGATDELTQTTNLLHDIRVGRGFYNSYNANNLLMRWPLDHLFVTKEFRVISLERMPKIGSDHFPIYTKLLLSP